MSARVRRAAAAFAVLLVAALAGACGGTSGSRATMAAPSVIEERPAFGPGDGEPGDGQEPIDSTVTDEPAPCEPAEPEPEQPSPELPQLTATEIASIKALLIQASIDAYDGSCPCPYHEDRAGRSCGDRSAHRRPGGAAPLCYPEDVSDEMVYEYWASQQ